MISLSWVPEWVYRGCQILNLKTRKPGKFHFCTTIDSHNIAHRTDLAWLNSEVEAISEKEPQQKIVILTHYIPTMAAEANEREHLEDSREVQSALASDLAMESC